MIHQSPSPTQTGDSITVLCTGDVILDVPHPEHWLAGIAPALACADVAVGHHAHIVRGIEFYRGKPVFHGLGNGCVVTHALDPGQAHPARAAGLPALTLQPEDGRISA